MGKYWGEAVQDRLVFKAGAVKQALGWVVFLGSGALLAALILAVIQNFETQTQADLWSGVVIGLLLVTAMAGGLAIQSLRWTAEGDTVTLRHLFGSKTWSVASLGGFGKLIISVSAFPLGHIELFDRDLKPIGRLAVTPKDMPAAEAWFAQRLRYVVNDGSAALPRRRYIDAPKA